MIRKSSIAIGIILLTLLTACQPPNASNQIYSASALTSANRTVEGKVVSKRLVSVQGTNAAGGTTGALLGGVAGSGVGGSDRANIAGAIAGAVAGGVAGATIEEASTRQKAYEYIVKSDVAGMLTVIQSDPDIHVGDNVYVILAAKPIIVRQGYQ